VFSAIRYEQRELNYRSLASFEFKDFDLQSLQRLQWNTDLPLGSRLKARIGILAETTADLQSAHDRQTGLLAGLDWRIDRNHSLRFSGNGRSSRVERAAERFEEPELHSRWGWSAEWKTSPNERFSAALRHLRNYSERQAVALENTTGKGRAWMLSIKAVQGELEEAEQTRWSWSFTTQVGWIDSDGWDNRFYLYEAGPVGSFSIPAYSAKTLFVNSLIRLSPGRNQSFWIRLARRERFENAVSEALNPWYFQLQWDARW
jgi:hypothetical protein